MKQKLKARVRNRTIEIFVIGKWRGVRYYPMPDGATVKNKKIIEECVQTVWLNTGRRVPIENITLEF